MAFCRCSTGVALHPLKILVSHLPLLPPPLVPGGVAPKFGSEKVSRYTGVSQLQLRVSRYTVQLSLGSGMVDVEAKWGNRNPIARYHVFQVSQGIALCPTNLSYRSRGEGVAGGIATQAALWGVSPCTGVALR